MTTIAEDKSGAIVRKLEELSATLAIVVGCLVLTGWGLDIPAFKSVLPDMATMRVNSALCFVLSGIAFWIAAAEGASGKVRPVGIAASALALLVVGSSLFESWWGWDLGFEEALFRAAASPGTAFPGHMSPNTAAAFLFLNIALLLLPGASSRSRLILVGLLGTLTALQGLFAALGWAGRAVIGYGWGDLTTMALHSGAVLALLGAACTLQAWRRTGLRLAIRGRLAAGFALGLVVFVVISLASYENARRFAEATDGMRRAQHVLGTLDETYSDCADIQSGVRGFIITGRDDFLAPYREGLRHLADDQRELRRLTADDPRQQVRFTMLEDLIRQRLAFSDENVDTRRPGGLEAAAQRVIAGRDQENMDQIRSVIRAMQSEENAHFAQREALAGNITAKASSVLPIGTLVGVGLFLGVLLFLNLEATERQRAEEALRHADREVRMISDCNQALVRATDEARLLEAICRIVVERGGYRMAWVGFAEQDEARTVRPAAHFGFEDGYLDTALTTWAEDERGGGPTGTAIRTERPAVCRNIPTDPAYRPWRAAAMQHGYASSIALPLTSNEHTFGVLALYATVPDAFPPEEQALLAGLADDLAYGITALRDRSQRKSTELARRRSERLFQLLMEHSPAAIAMFDRDMKYLTVSRRYLVDYRLGDQELAGRSHYDVFPDIPEYWKEVHRRCLAGATETAAEDPIPRSDGRTDWVRWEIRPWYEVTGEIGGIIQLSEVITERKLGETMKRENEERLRLAIDAAHAGTFDWNIPDDHITWSRWHEELWGFQPGEFGGTYAAFSQRVHPEDLPGIDTEVARCISRREQFKKEFRIVWPDGSVHWIMGRGEFYFDQRGEAMRMLGVVVETTELKRAEQERDRLQAELRRHEAMAAMGALVGGVAHEARNPLFGMSATLDAFEARFGEREEYQRYLPVLRGELDRLNQLMGDLLEYGKPLEADLRPGSIGDVITDAITACGALARQSDVQVVTSDTASLPSIDMDRARLCQVFQNLLDNAIRVSARGGTVWVGAEDGHANGRPWIECTVRDDGPGFQPEDLARVFEPFFTRRRDGTGLGLSVVQRIVEEHGGNVSARNRAEGGAEVVVRLPVGKAADA